MRKTILAAFLFLVIIAGCAALIVYQQRPAPDLAPTVARPELRFDGARAHALAVQFATGFPNRHSGTAANQAAAQWLQDQFTRLNLAARVDESGALLHGQPVTLHNVIAVKPGQVSEAVVLVAHLDQARSTVQGADNDASGIGALLHLAEVFARENPRRTLVFLASDGEEYGMLGARRFLEATPPPGHIAAAISLDNIGRGSGTGLHLAVMGQGQGYTDLWLARLAQQAAAAAGLWRPAFPDPIMQLLERAVPFSFTDQGPFLARGIPAFDLGVTAPEWPYYHTPEDTVDRIAPGPLGQAGLAAEAVLRELARRPELPPGQPDYLYLDSGQAGSYIPLWPLRVLLLALFLPLFYAAVAAWRAARPGPAAVLAAALRLFLNTLPALAGLLALYGLVELNFIPRFSYYPAPPLDPSLYQPAYPALAAALAAILLLLAGLARVVVTPAAGEVGRRPLAWTLLSLLALAVFYRNSLALIFLLPPAYLYLALRPRRSPAGRGLNLLLLLAGGMTVYALLYFFAGLIQVGPYMGWYFAQMLALGMIDPAAALAGVLAIGCGLTLAGGQPAGLGFTDWSARVYGRGQGAL